MGLAPPERGNQRTPSPMPTLPGSGLPTRPAQNNTLVVARQRETGLPRRPCLALRMALIVSWGPLGTSPTQARRVLRHEAAGPWTLAGRRLGDHSHVTGIQVSPSALQAASGSHGCALGTCKT